MFSFGRPRLYSTGYGCPSPSPALSGKPILPALRLPQSLFPGEGDPDGIPVVFQYVALSGYTQLRGIDADATRNKAVAPPLLKVRVVGVFVEDRPVGGAEIFHPLILNMDERPLPATEAEMLQAGELEKVLFGIDHPLRVQVTPSGRCASSTVTA